MTVEGWQRGMRARRTSVLMVFDAVVLAAAYIFSIWLRYDSADRFPHVGRAAVVVVAAVALQLFFGRVWGVYQGRVGVATIEETLFHGLASATAGSIVFVVNALFAPHWIARSVPLSATFLGLFLMLTARALWRYRSDHVFGPRVDGCKPTIVIGAGYSGSRLAHSMLSNPESGMDPVAFLDDDPWKRKRRIYGIPVLGTLADLGSAVAKSGAQVAVVAISGADSEVMAPLAERANDLGVELKVLPPFAESLATTADVRDVRDVDMRDILRRPPMETDVDSIAGYLKGKRVLVTGAGGSIGSELCRQINHYEPAELIMLDRDESALHAVQLSIRGQALLDSEEVVLNDIRDLHALRQLFETRRPEVVFHAAALKHLPLLERYPFEAMKTNVLGTANVLQAATEVGVETFVNVSTDKAADPTSVLGYSKRVAERLTAATAQEADGSYVSVRFGNVLGSRGSVLHTFTAQIAAGGPVTVVDPEITRYFMTVEEAVQLVIQAGAFGEDGGVMILDMGEPVKIDDVARQLIRLSGKDIEIVYTGLREGEKLHEQLFGGAEDDARSKHPLVSHAPVSALAPDVVRQYDLNSSEDDLLQAYHDWMRLPDPVATVGRSVGADQ